MWCSMSVICYVGIDVAQKASIDISFNLRSSVINFIHIQLWLWFTKPTRDYFYVNDAAHLSSFSVHIATWGQPIEFVRSNRIVGWPGRFFRALTRWKGEGFKFQLCGGCWSTSQLNYGVLSWACCSTLLLSSPNFSTSLLRDSWQGARRNFVSIWTLVLAFIVIPLGRNSNASWVLCITQNTIKKKWRQFSWWL